MWLGSDKRMLSKYTHTHNSRFPCQESRYRGVEPPPPSPPPQKQQQQQLAQHYVKLWLTQLQQVFHEATNFSLVCSNGRMIRPQIVARIRLNAEGR